jgi:glycosyltransferase involved in cell wall biosynthesis
VNDGSEDKSMQILEEYAKRDNRFVVINQKNSGAGVARNKGLNIAKSEYIIFIDSDDWIELDTLEKLYNTIKKENVDLVIGGMLAVEEDETMIDRRDMYRQYYGKSRKAEGKYEIQEDFTKYRSSSCCKLYKKAIIDKYNLRFPEGFIYEDEAWHWYYSTSIKFVYFLDKMFYNRLVHGESVMSKSIIGSTKTLDMIKILEYIYNYLQKNKLYEKYQILYEQYFLSQKRNTLKRCNQNIVLYKKAEKEFDDLACKYAIATN